MAPLLFAYWVPNVSGGLVNSKIPQRTSHDLDYNIKLARTAEEKGFAFALTQIRFLASYGAAEQFESMSFSHALLARTERLNILAAVLPGPWHPALTAKMAASIDIYTGGRLSLNVVSGWFQKEQDSMGLPMPAHDERYVRSTEFIRCLRGLWNEDNFTFKGKYFNFDDFTLSPKPSIRVSTSSTSTSHGTFDGSQPEGTRGPIIFQGGNSVAARRMAGTDADFFFLNGNDDETFAKWILEVRGNAEKAGRRIKIGIHGFVIAKETEQEALQQLNEIVNGADSSSLDELASQLANGGQASPEGEGMWTTAQYKDLVQYNEGFRTGLIGTYEQVARRIIALKALGADLVLTAFLHFQEEVEEFGDKVLPLVREYEQQAVDSGEVEAWPTYEHYPVPEEKKSRNTVVFGHEDALKRAGVADSDVAEKKREGPVLEKEAKRVKA